MAQSICLSNFQSFQNFHKLFYTHIYQKNIQDSNHSRSAILDGVQWILERTSYEPNQILLQISENEILLMMFFYGLKNDSRDFTQHLYEIIIGKDRSIWSTVVLLMADVFRPNEDELWAIVAGLSDHPVIRIKSLPEQIGNYIKDFCSRLGYLYRSCFEGQLRMTECIIESGVEVNAPALHAAAENANHDIVKLLLSSGAKIDWTNDKGESAVYLAVEQGKAELVELYIAKAAKPEVKCNGMTLLHIAVKNAHSQVVELLLDNGFNASATTDHGETPLHMACRSGNEDIVESLLARGAKVNMLSRDIKTPLHTATENNHVSIVRKLLGTNEVQMDMEMSNGNAPLHIAAICNFLLVAEALLGHGANVNKKNNENNSPAHFAASQGHVLICEQLVEYGCTFEDSNIFGQIPLHLAVLNGKEEAVELVLSVTSAVDCQDMEGRTPLHLAAYGGKSRIILLLLQRGVDQSKVCNKGYSAIHYAAEQGHVEAVETLLLHKVDFACMTASGLTPLQLAKSAGKEDVVRLLTTYTSRCSLM